MTLVMAVVQGMHLLMLSSHCAYQLVLPHDWPSKEDLPHTQVLNNEGLSQPERVQRIGDLNKRLQARSCRCHPTMQRRSLCSCSVISHYVQSTC